MNNEVTIYAPSLGKFDLVEVRGDREQYPRVSSVSKEQAIHNIALLIGKVCMLKGVSMNEATMRFNAVAVLDEILNNELLDDISFSEIDYAFRRGAYGAYGEMYGVNAVSLIKCLQSWVMSEETMNAVAEARARRRRERQALIDQEQAAKVDRLVGVLAKQLSAP